MIEPARKLRRADEQQLRVVLAALRRGGRFVVVVADEATWPDAREVLARGLTPPPLHEVRLITGDDVIRLFSSPEVDGEGAVVIHIGNGAAGAVEALNLHRDKLRQQRCRFVLRLDGAALHQRFPREAPDCYSFRDAVAVVQGRLAPAQPEHDDERLEVLRRSAAVAETPEELRQLARAFIAINRLAEAYRALDQGIAILSAREELSPEDRLTLADLHCLRASHASADEHREHFRSALRVIDPVREQFATQYAHILGQIRDGYGIDIDAARESLAIVRRSEVVDPESVASQLVCMAAALDARSDIKGAREALRQASSPMWWESAHNKFYDEDLEIGILIEEGRWEESEERLWTSVKASAEAGFANWVTRFAFALAQLLIMRGELDAALDILGLVTLEDARPLRMRILCSRGEPDAIATLAAPLLDCSPGADQITDALNQAYGKASTIRSAIRAGLLGPSRSERLDAELEALAAHVAAVAPLDPPWSRIKAELLIADNLLARTGAEDMARAAAERALALARTGAQEQIPNCVRRIAVAALRTGAMDGLADLLDEAFAAAEARHLPGEAARLAGLRLWHLTRLGQDTTQAEQALNAAIDRTGSVLVEAEVLYQAGRGTGRRDLLERSRRIYRSLPWPEREGECLEALGMKAAARTRYETFGLRLAALALERRTEPPPIVA